MEVYACPCLHRPLMINILKDLLYVGRGVVSREGVWVGAGQVSGLGPSSCTHDSGVCRMPQESMTVKQFCCS